MPEFRAEHGLGHKEPRAFDSPQAALTLEPRSRNDAMNVRMKMKALVTIGRFSPNGDSARCLPSLKNRLIKSYSRCGKQAESGDGIRRKGPHADFLEQLVRIRIDPFKRI